MKWLFALFIFASTLALSLWLIFYPGEAWLYPFCESSPFCESRKLVLLLVAMALVISGGAGYWSWRTKIDRWNKISMIFAIIMFAAIALFHFLSHGLSGINISH